jgi:RimJ/RimL family protein N-acetyltransferase
VRLERIFAETMTVNLGSRATMAKVGLVHIRSFQPESEVRRVGWELGEVEYAITHQEWLARR